MKGKQLITKFNGLSLQRKAIAVVVLIVLAFFIKKVIDNFAFKLGASVGKPADGSTQGITNQQAISIADRQLEAMDKPGQDVDELFDSLAGLNGADLRQVYKAFGKKSYDPIFGMEGDSVLDTLGISKPKDLFGWYAEELKSKLGEMKILWEPSGLPFY